MDKLKIEYIGIDQLKTYPNNAKIHTAEQVEQIKKSISEFGFNDPIAVWGNENEIIEGHGRLMAARELGIDEIPIIRLDELNDEQRRAYMLVHNKLTMNTDFDLDLLSDELGKIFELDMSDFGFIDDAIEPLDQKNDDGLDFHETYQVIVELENEDEQEKLFTKLSEEGYTCRLSTL